MTEKLTPNDVDALLAQSKLDSLKKDVFDIMINEEYPRLVKNTGLRNLTESSRAKIISDLDEYLGQKVYDYLAEHTSELTFQELKDLK